MRISSGQPRPTFWDRTHQIKLNTGDLNPHPKLKMGIYAGIGTALFAPATLLAGLATPFMLVTGDSTKVGRMWNRVGNLVDYKDMYQRVNADPYL